jgi:hypothetical protein
VACNPVAPVALRSLEKDRRQMRKRGEARGCSRRRGGGSAGDGATSLL